MKKLLMTLSALGITASSAASVVACGNTDKDSVTDKVVGVIASELSEKTTERLTLQVANDKQTQENVRDKIIAQNPTLKKYEKKLSVKVTDFEKASKQGDQGKITLEVLNKEDNIKNPKDNTNQFTFSFLTKDILDDMTTTVPEVIPGVDNALNAEPTLSLSNINIDLSGTGVDLLKDVKSVGDLIKLVVTTGANLIPAKVPTNFTDDLSWTGFQALLNLIKPIIGDNDTIDETITPMDGTTFHIKLKITDVLKNILPDLIHLKNFVAQENQNGNKNLILNLMHYFFAKPANINGDGFAGIDQGIKNINYDPKEPDNGPEIIAFENNLERLVYHLLEGWKTADGTPLPDGVEPIYIKFSTVTEILGSPTTIEQIIRYQSDSNATENTAGIFNLFPENNIFNFIDLLLGTNHSQDENSNETGGYNLEDPLAFTLLVLGGAVEQSVPTTGLADAIKGSLKTFLANSNPELATKLDYLTLDWTQGTMTVEYQTEANGSWQQAKTLANLTTATNLRVKFINNTWLVKNKLNDDVKTITGKSLTLNLDLTTALTLPAAPGNTTK